MKALSLGRGIVQAASVVEAVAIAQRLREMNQAQWFRGQVRTYPKLTPLLHRPDVDFSRAEKAMYRFAHWVKSTPGLEEIAASTDATLAVAQHHGLPTPFLDFTTEPGVAGYFASVTRNPPPQGTESCIYCLNIEEADRIWGIRPGEAPERVVVDVPNLWRLEAQRGVFVWCPFDDLNGPFPIDQILFPYLGPISSPTDPEIYPERESALEARLREYFQAEDILKGSAVFEEIQRHVPMRSFTIEAPPVMAEYFLAPPTPHTSWADLQQEGWLKVTRESWSEVLNGPKISFSTLLSGIAATEAARFKNVVKAALEEAADLRQRKVVWHISVEGSGDEAVMKLNSALQRVWDEMARLPWTDEDIGMSMSVALRCFLEAEGLHNNQGLSGRELERATMGRIFVKPIRVELGGLGNIHTFAWVEEDELHAAVRPDFESLLREENRARIIGHTFNTLMVSRSPAYLFDFDELSSLFAREMIPTQAVFYPDHPLFPTPARVHVIGPE